jgi:hypothetical protein
MNSGNNTTCKATDQRGENRSLSSGNACDVGAVEVLNESSMFVVPLPHGKSVIFNL